MCELVTDLRSEHDYCRPADQPPPSSSLPLGSTLPPPPSIQPMSSTPATITNLSNLLYDSRESPGSCELSFLKKKYLCWTNT